MMTKEFKTQKGGNIVATARQCQGSRATASEQNYSIEELDNRARKVTELLKKILEFPLPHPK